MVPEEEFIMTDVMASGNQSRELRSHIVNHKQEAKTVKWKWGDVINAPSLSSVISFPQQGSTFSGFFNLTKRRQHPGTCVQILKPVWNMSHQTIPSVTTGKKIYDCIHFFKKKMAGYV